MKKILLAILLTFSIPIKADPYMLMPVIEVYDGDTIKTTIGVRRLPPPLNELSIRVRGIDTPELPAKSFYETGKLGRAECVAEAIHALAAKRAVETLVAESGSDTMKVTNFEWDKYGGRIVADVKIGGIDVATFLIVKGFAVSYDGGTKTHSWCEQV